MMCSGLQGGRNEMSMLISASSVLNRAYAGNVFFKDENYRKNSSNHEVVNADRRAMARALERLERLDFDSKDEDATKSIYNTVTSYLDIYNNTVSSANDSGSSDIRRSAKNMKELMKTYSSSLEEIGITIKSDGTVRIDKSELKKATTRQVKKIFGNSDYVTGMNKLMKKLRNQVNREAPVQNTQSGTKADAGDILVSETVGRNLNLYG